MNELIQNSSYDLRPIEDSDRELRKEDIMAICEATKDVVSNVAATVDNITATVREINLIKAKVELETRQLEHAFDCLMVKAQRDITIYRETLPLLDKNFESMQARMDRLMDKAMDIICEDVSDASLARQEMCMNLIEKTNNMLNNLIGKLLPSY